MTPVLYFNGEFIPEDSFKIRPSNRALHYGDGVFETMRAYRGRVFRLNDHIERLSKGLDVLGIQRCEKNRIADAVSGVLNQNKYTEATVKIIAFRQGPEGPTPPLNVSADIVVTAHAFDEERKKIYEKGITAHVVSTRRNETSPLANIKSLNYLDNILGRIEARRRGALEALFLNTSGYVAEGAASNVFLVRNNALCTPPVRAGILEGITRKVIIEIAERASITVVEECFKPDVLMNAQEAFLTNSSMEVIPLIQLNGTKIGSGTPGECTNRFMGYYVDTVYREIESQA